MSTTIIQTFRPTLLIYTSLVMLPQVWRHWMKSAGSDDNGLLTASIFVESMKQERNDPEFREAYLEISRYFFGLLDVDGDGFLQEDEYARSLANIGIKDISVARMAFDSIDLDGDGKLSLDEFCPALLEYITSEDENSPYTMLWGPLIE